MYDQQDDELFGHDCRHRPPFSYLPAKPSRFECLRQRSQYFRHQSRKRNQNIDSLVSQLEELFDCPKAIGGDYMFMSTALRYVLFTWSVGRIEVDVLSTHILLLPEDTYRDAIYARLNNAGYYYQIVGDSQFIKIKRHEKEN